MFSSCFYRWNVPAHSETDEYPHYSPLFVFLRFIKLHPLFSIQPCMPLPKDCPQRSLLRATESKPRPLQTEQGLCVWGAIRRKGSEVQGFLMCRAGDYIIFHVHLGNPRWVCWKNWPGACFDQESTGSSIFSMLFCILSSARPLHHKLVQNQTKPNHWALNNNRRHFSR